MGVEGRCISYGNEGYRVGCGVASDKGCNVGFPRGSISWGLDKGVVVPIDGALRRQLVDVGHWGPWDYGSGVWR